LFKLVYDEQKDKAWAHWQENLDTAKASPPTSYGELVASQILSVDELTERLNGEPSVKTKTHKDFVQSTFASGLILRVMDELRSEAEPSFAKWTSSKSRELLLLLFPPS
jgi:hypothetical protein